MNIESNRINLRNKSIANNQRQGQEQKQKQVRFQSKYRDKLFKSSIFFRNCFALVYILVLLFLFAYCGRQNQMDNMDNMDNMNNNSNNNNISMVQSFYDADGYARSNGLHREIQRVLGNDSAANDQFGFSVDISGNYAIVGVPSDDDGGPNSGSAYIFSRNASNGMWQQMAKINGISHAGNNPMRDRFGYSVAIDGTNAIVGSPIYDANVSGSIFFYGSAHVFSLNASNGMWQAKQILFSNDSIDRDRFGISVDINGNNAIIGAAGDDVMGSESGSAYIFRLNASGMWQQAQQLVASDSAPNKLFGYSVAIDGSNAIVGAHSDNSESKGNNSGSAYIFSLNASGIWQQAQKLVASDMRARDNFGISVGISGTNAIIGATPNNHYDFLNSRLSVDRTLEIPFNPSHTTFHLRNINTVSGSAYIFSLNASRMWQQTQKLVANDVVAGGNNFGISVDIDGNNAIVGAYLDNDRGENSGSAYIFSFNSSNMWQQIAKPNANEVYALDQFGYSVAIDGSNFIVGSRYDDDKGFNSGSAYLFRYRYPGNRSSR